LLIIQAAAKKNPSLLASLLAPSDTPAYGKRSQGLIAWQKYFLKKVQLYQIPLIDSFFSISLKTAPVSDVLFRPEEIHSTSGIVYMRLYPNRWDLINHN